MNDDTKPDPFLPAKLEATKPEPGKPESVKPGQIGPAPSVAVRFGQDGSIVLTPVDANKKADDGNGLPASLNARSVATASPAPADSPASAIRP